jgi:excisionase family DNA binding protein
MANLCLNLKKMDKLIVTMTEQELKALVRQSVSEGVEAALMRTKETEPEGNLLKKKEAAKLLSCCTSTIDNLARRKKLTRHYVGKRAVRFNREQVLSMAEQTHYYKSKPAQRNAI